MRPINDCIAYQMSGNRTSYEYDALNRVLTITNELDDTRTKVYDDTGNVVTVEDRNGRVRRFTYRCRLTPEYGIRMLSKSKLYTCPEAALDQLWRFVRSDI